MKVRKQLVTIVAFLFVMVCSLCVSHEVNAADTAMIENVMNVKCQVTAGTDASTKEAVNLRLVTSVDSLNYAEVGFEIYYNGAKTPIPAKVDTVFKRIVASAESGVDYNYNPKVISTDAEYFATVTLLDIAPGNFDKPFYIKPYCRTLDGQTIYGVSRYVKVSDSYNDVVNVPVKVTADQATNMTVDFETTKLQRTEGYAHDGTYAHLTFKVNDGQELSSVTKFTIKDSAGETIDTAYHRNPLTKYTGGETYDRSWYDTNTSATEFVIATSADLYGLAEVAKEYNFRYKTIYLGADIIVNEGDAKTWSSGTTGLYSWETAIGTSDRWFFGDFDGCGDTISGIYMYSSKAGVGLFGYTSAETYIKNLRLENSYFETTAVGTTTDPAPIGSVVGISYKTDMDSVYSNAKVVSSGIGVGGLIGRAMTGNEHRIANSQFDGIIEAENNSRYIGGVLGLASVCPVTVESFLYTGTINSQYNAGGVALGGIVGQVVSSSTAYQTLTVSDSLIAGELNTAGKYNVGLVAGTGYITADLTNVYTYVDITGVAPSFHSTSKGFGNGATFTLADNKNINELTADTATGMAAFDLSLDYADTWVVTTTGHPELKQFAIANAMPADTSWYEEASATQKYTITTMEELYGLAVLAQSNVFTGWEFKLGNDITVNSGESDGWATTAPKYMWLPIGNSTYSFNGTFDGQGHTIKGIYLKTTTTRIGLFGDVNTSCQIKNLALRNSYFENPSAGYSYLGSIAGWARKVNLQSVYSDATVVSGNSTTALESVVGGLVGCASTNVQHSMINCWFDGETQGDKCVGGMVGWLYLGTMQMTNCLNTGVVFSDFTGAVMKLGGFCGQVATDVTFTNCLNLSDIQVDYADGVGSYVGNATNSTKKATFTNTYSIEKFTLPSGVNVDKDGVGSNSTVTTVITTIGTLNVLPEEYLQGYWGYQMTGFDFEDTWVAKAGETPELKAFSKGANLLIKSDVIVADTTWYDASATNQTIVDEADFYGLTKLSLLNNTFAGKVVELSDDIELNPGWKITDGVPKNEWVPIGQLSGSTFAGSFNGNGHVISGVYVDSEVAYTGIFGQAGGSDSNAYIKNFIVRDSYFHNTAGSIGAVAGFGHVDISDIYIEDTVKVSSSGVATGGIVGLFGSNNERTLSNCWFDGTVESSYSGNFQNCGGIVGQINMGTKTISNCLNTGTVIGNYAGNGLICVGGIIGRVDKSQYATNLAVTIDSCLNASDLDVNHNYGAGSIAGQLNAGTVTIQNTYTTGDIWDTKNDAKPIEVSTGVGIANGSGTYNKDDITLVAENDISGLDGYYNTRLGFYIEGQEESQNDVWVVREGDVPAPKPFATAMNLTLPMDLRTDTSWYEANTSTKAYTITTKEELAGFSELSQTKNFNGWTITLGNNIVFNKDINNPAYTWTPIGQSLAFAGTFDGALKTISGVYCKSDKIYVGLFGQTLNGSKIQNLSLKDSYFECTVDVADDASAFAGVGSVVGFSNSDLENVYSKATVKGYGLGVGGLVGLVQNLYTKVEGEDQSMNHMTTRTYKSCWFDGSLTSDHQRVGGIVGGLIQGGLSFVDCLYTGTMELSCANTSNGTRAGGILGHAQQTWTKVTFDNIISAGTINNTTGNSNVGTVIGRISDVNEGVILTNVYATQGTSVGYTATEIEGAVTEVPENEQLNFYNIVTSDDFKETWTLQKTGLPGLTIFVPEDERFTDEVLSLSYFPVTLSLKDARDAGEGNYVMTYSDANITNEQHLEYYNGYGQKLIDDNGFTKVYDNKDDEESLAQYGVHTSVYSKETDRLKWVVTLTHAGNNKKETYISVATVRSALEVLSPHMVKDNDITYTADDGFTTSGKDITLRMNKLDDQNGTMNINGFVIQLPNGHFIINDGGTNYDCKNLIDYLCSISDGKKPIIEAWTISHFHCDHANVFKEFIDTPSYVDKVYVEAIYVNTPSAESIALESDVAPIIDNVRQAVRMLKTTENKNTRVYRYQTGQRFYFDGVTMDVVQAQEQIPVSAYNSDDKLSHIDQGKFNTTSTGLMFTIDDGTDSGKKVYIGGDQTNVNQDWMMEAYNASLFNNVNVFVLLHHGANTTEEFAKWCTNDYQDQFDIVLYPRDEIVSYDEETSLVFNLYSKFIPNACKGGIAGCYSYYDGSVLLTFKYDGITVTVQE